MLISVFHRVVDLGLSKSMQACRSNATFLHDFLHTYPQGLKFFKNNFLLSVKNIHCCDCTPHLSSNPTKEKKIGGVGYLPNCCFMRRRISEILYVAINKRTHCKRFFTVNFTSAIFFTNTAYLASTQVCNPV